MKKLSYAQLRAILALAVTNDLAKGKLSDLLSGGMANISEIDLLSMIAESQVDMEMIRILSGRDPETMDALAGLEYISDFFAYIRANKDKFKGWLGSLGLKAVVPQSTE